MKTTSIGKKAESKVAELLKAKGFKILAMNWRTKVCEIDVVAKKDNVVYFAEVKYRSSQSQGDGFDYITPRKLKKMTFAAQIWVNQNDWQGDWRLVAASVSGGQIQIVEL